MENENFEYGFGKFSYLRKLRVSRVMFIVPRRLGWPVRQSTLRRTRLP